MKFLFLSNQMRITIKHIIVTIFLTSLLSPCIAYCQQISDSLSSDLSHRELKICEDTDLQFTKFDAKQLILPGSLMITGLIGVIDSDNNLNKSVRDAMVGLSNNKVYKIDDYLRFLPSASHLVMGSLGIKSRHNFKERFLISATAHAAMLVMGYGMKYAFHEQRPDFSDNHSFPSGHVAFAFTGAELLRSEYGTAYGIAGYAVATGVAFLRLYNNRHWFNDVLMGAGIGILSAKIGCWLLPFERKVLKINRKDNNNSTIALAPAYDVFNKSYMITLNAVF